MKKTLDVNTLTELKKRLKIRFPQLTNNDLLVTNGNAQNMLTIIAYKLRKSKEEMIKIIEKL